MLATMFALFVPPAHAVSLVLVIGDSCVVSRVDSILIHVGFKGNAGCHCCGDASEVQGVCVGVVRVATT